MPILCQPECLPLDPPVLIQILILMLGVVAILLDYVDSDTCPFEHGRGSVISDEILRFGCALVDVAYQETVCGVVVDGGVVGFVEGEDTLRTRCRP